MLKLYFPVALKHLADKTINCCCASIPQAVYLYYDNDCATQMNLLLQLGI